MPVSVGRLLTSSVKASMPPAEAPTAAIRRSFLRSGGAEPSSLEELRASRPVDFGFISFVPVEQTAESSLGRSAEHVVPRCYDRMTVCSSLYSATAAWMTAQPRILVFPHTGNNLNASIWGGGRSGRDLNAISIVYGEVGIGMRGAVVGLEERSGRVGVIIDELQVFGGRLSDLSV